MIPEKLLEDIKARLNAKTIHDLRQVARAVGVPRPADGRKERLLDYIEKIAMGVCDPVGPAVRGAHPKSAEYDRQLVTDVFRCRAISLSDGEEDNGVHFELSVGSGAEFDPLDFNGDGLLEKSGDKWFMRASGADGSPIEVFVHENFVNKYGLREGDTVSGKCKRDSLDEMAGLVTVHAVNGAPAEGASERPFFDNLEPVYPCERIKIDCGQDGVTGRIVDLFAPVGKGQRAFITGPHGSGKTRLLKNIALGIRSEGVKTVIALIDARPEEVSDFYKTFPDTDVFTSSFDAGDSGHVRTAKLALEYCKRRAESGEDVVLLLDDLVRLTRAYNMCGKQFLSVIDSSAVGSVKKYLAAAKNTTEGGSLTIIATLGSGEGEDENTVLSALKDLCNMRINLSYDLARAYVRPPIDLAQTFSSHEEALLTSEELSAAVKLRGKDIREIIKIFENTGSDKELFKSL